MPTESNDPLKKLRTLFQNDDAHDVCNTLSDFIPGIVCVYDTGSKKLRYINKKVTELLGFTYDDIDAWQDDWKNLIFEEDNEFVTSQLQQFFELEQDKSHSFNSRLNHKLGNWRYFKTQGTVLRRGEDGKAASVLLIAQDITEHQTALEENIKLNEILEDTQRMLDFGVWTLDFATGKAQCSKGYYRLFDYAENETPEVTFESHMAHIPDPERKRVTALITKAKEDATEFETEHVIITQKQEKKIVLCKGKFVTDENGEVVKMIGSTMNISKVRKTEKDLDTKIEDLNRSNKDLEEFAYIASHDLQEPLRKISTFSERLSMKFQDVLQEEGNVYIARMMAATETMRQLIDNLLEYSRITRNRQVFENVNLNTIVKQVQNDLDFILDETGTTIHLKPLPVIKAMPLQIKQLFQNLISNAIKFRRKTVPAIISISSENLSADEYATHGLPIDKHYYKIEVTDNGIGFEKEYATKIFMIFQRLHGKAEYPGSGIGLSICKKIMDNHEGLIYAQSKPGEGSTFTVILPQ